MAEDLPKIIKSEDYLLRSLLKIPSLTGETLVTVVRFAFLGPTCAAAVRRAISPSPAEGKHTVDVQQKAENDECTLLSLQISSLFFSESSRKIISLQLDVRDARQNDRLLTSRPPLGCWAHLHDEDYGLDIKSLPNKDVLHPRKSYCFSLGVSGESYLGANAGIFFIWLDPNSPMSNNNVAISSSSTSITETLTSSLCEADDEGTDNLIDKIEIDCDNNDADDGDTTLSGSTTLSADEVKSGLTEKSSSSTRSSSTISSATSTSPLSPSLSVKIVSPHEMPKNKAKLNQPLAHSLPSKYAQNIQNFAKAYASNASSSGISTVFNGLQCALAVAEASCDERFNVPSQKAVVDPKEIHDSSIIATSSSLPLCTNALVRHHPQRLRSDSKPGSSSISQTKTLWEVYEKFAGGDASSFHIHKILGKEAFGDESSDGKSSFDKREEDHSFPIRWINCCDIARLCVLWLLGGGSAYLDTDMACPPDLLQKVSSSANDYVPLAPTMSRLLPPSLVSRTPFQRLSFSSSSSSTSSSSSPFSYPSTYTDNDKDISSERASGPAFPTLFVAQDADGVLQNNFFALADGVSTASSSSSAAASSSLSDINKSALHHPLLSLLLQAVIASALEESHVIHATGPALVTAVFHAFRQTKSVFSSSNCGMKERSSFADTRSTNSSVSITRYNDASIPFWSLPRVTEDSSSFVHFKTLLIHDSINTSTSHENSPSSILPQSVTLGDTVWVLPPSSFFTSHWRDAVTPPPPAACSASLSAAPPSPPLLPVVNVQARPSVQRSSKIPSSLRSASIPLPPAKFGFFGPVLPDASVIGHGASALTPRSLQRSLGMEGNLRGRREKQEQEQQPQLRLKQQIQDNIGDDLMSSSLSSSSSSSPPSSTLSSLHLSSPLSISVPTSSTFIFESTHNEDGEIIDYNAKIFENNKEGEEEEAYDAISRLPFTTEEEVLGQSVSQQPLTQETKLRRRGGGGGGGGGGQIEGGGEMPPALYGFGPMQPSPPPFVWVAPTTSSTSSIHQPVVTNGGGGGGGGERRNPPIFGLHGWDCTWGKDTNNTASITENTQQHPYAAAFSIPNSSSNTSRPSLFPYARAAYYAAAAASVDHLQILFPRNGLTSMELLATQAKERQDAVSRSRNLKTLTTTAVTSLQQGSHLTEADARFAIQEERRRNNGGGGHDSNNVVELGSTFHDIFGVSFLARRIVSRLADSGLPALPPQWAVKLWLSGDEAGDLQGATQKELIDTITRIVEDLE